MEQIDTEDVKRDYQRLENDFINVRSIVVSYKKIRFITKTIGILAMIYFLFTKNWLFAFFMWFLFVPDLADVTKWVKNKFNRV